MEDSSQSGENPDSNPTRECINMKLPNSREKSVQSRAGGQALLSMVFGRAENRSPWLSPAPTMHFTFFLAPKGFSFVSLGITNGLQSQLPQNALALRIRDWLPPAQVNIQTVHFDYI